MSYFSARCINSKNVEIPDGVTCLGHGFYVSPNPLVEVDKNLLTEFGTFHCNELTNAGLWIYTGTPYNNEALDCLNMKMEAFWHALIIHFVPSIRVCWTVSGHRTIGGHFIIDSLRKKDEVYPDWSQIDIPLLSIEHLNAVSKTANLLYQAHVERRWMGRLSRGLYSLMYGAYNRYIDSTHTDFVRSLDALLHY